MTKSTEIIWYWDDTQDQANPIDLDQLQAEVEKLLALLKNREPGLMTWNMFLHDRLQSIFKLAKAMDLENEGQQHGQ